MHKLIVLLLLASLSMSSLGCGNSSEPPKDEEGNTIKAPGAPPKGP